MNISEYRNKLLSEISESRAELDERTKAILGLAGDGEKISETIAVINDANSSPKETAAAIDALHTVSVFSPVLRTKMPEMVNALRGQMRSQDASIRRRAFGSLAAMKDEVAQERLIAEIKSEKPEEEKLVRTSEAIAMLGKDEKALPASLLRDIASNPPDTASLIESIRHLPADRDSMDLLTEVMRNDELPLEARAMIPEKVCEIDPVAFLDTARSLLESEGAAHDLGPFLVRGIAGVSQPEAAAEVAAEVEKTKSMIRGMLDDSPDTFRSLARDLLLEEDPPDDE